MRVCQICVSDEATEQVGELQLCPACWTDYTSYDRSRRDVNP